MVATAIADAQARVELRGFAEEQAALRRVATLVARAAPPEEVFGAVAEEAGRLLGTDSTVMSRYDPDGAAMVVGVWDGTGAARVIPVGLRLGFGGRNVHTLVFQTGRPGGSMTTPPPRAMPPTPHAAGGSARPSACRSASRTGCGGS
jgi:GAF domain-containing protein